MAPTWERVWVGLSVPAGLPVLLPKCTHSTEHEGLGINPADRVPILEHTTHQFTPQEGIDAYQAQAQSRTASVQSWHTDSPPTPQLDQAITENESDSPSRTI